MWLCNSVVSVLIGCGLCGADLSAVTFEPHSIDFDNATSSSAVIDVNRDGRPDIVAGGWWYAAPDWKRTAVREVELIRGRLDDYSNLAIDVNHDGRLDIVSANYRSGKLYWIEQPADSTQPWPVHLVETPGRMETARLVDLNGDGRLDVLPNGIDWAAWWELPAAGSAGGAGNLPWKRHDLPKELAGHGIGTGDMNGDGRLDVISRNGWAEQPAQAGDPWIMHFDFQLHRDASIPILVQDVDRDGDRDVIWGRGHGAGLYWLEQVSADKKPIWIRHAIDTSWTQAHTLLLADLTGDGIPEVVAGKRSLGHDGKDAGEWDAPIIAAYQYQADSRSWTRAVLSNTVGWDLDPHAADLDQDGDLDLVCPSRAGLAWLENKGLRTTEGVASPEFHDDLGIAAATYPAHNTVLSVHPAGSEVRPVASPADWGRRRDHLRANMQLVMGLLPGPERRIPLELEVVSTEQADGYTRKKIRFTSEPGDRVPAWLLIPANLETKPQSTPAMLCLHQTTGIGKDEPAGLGGLPNLHYAHELARRGYVCIVPDYPSFGEYPYDFKVQGAHYASGSMKAIWNNLRAVDVLEQILEVDADRIGVIGHSLGGHNALFTATFDLRLKAVVTSCGYTAFHHYYGGKLAGWTSDRYMPRIRDVYENNPDKVPFDFPEILAGLAPRACFSNSPIGDSNFDVTGVRQTVDEARKIYDLLGVPADQLRLETPEASHDFPPAIREKAYDWLDGQLKK